MAEDDLSLDLSGRKKTKKKKIVLEDDKRDGAGGPQLETAPTADGLLSQPVSESMELKLGDKKKKKRGKIGAEVDDKARGEELVDGKQSGQLLAESNLVDANGDWPDFTYDELLNLVYVIMREKNPDLTSGEKKKFVMRPPQVARAGSKKTAFANFAEICRLLKRQPKHVLQFLLAELGTTGSIDGNNCLIVKGRFQQKHIENVLRHYIKEYVTCHTCRSSDTELTKDTRLFFLQCQTCGSRCSVATIKSGFTAVVGKRAALRRAAETTGPAK